MALPPLLTVTLTVMVGISPGPLLVTERVAERRILPAAGDWSMPMPRYTRNGSTIQAKFPLSAAKAKKSKPKMISASVQTLLFMPGLDHGYGRSRHHSLDHRI